jgi:hypothetical protein
MEGAPSGIHLRQFLRVNNRRWAIQPAIVGDVQELVMLLDSLGLLRCPITRR